MSLELYRNKLREILVTFNAENQGAVLEAVNNWWIAYKEWEKADTFETAFIEKRMTARTIKFETEHTSLKMTRESEPEKGKQDVIGKSSTGITAMAQRMDPTKFVSDTGRTSSKYDFGLHDMSSSLLHPERPIGSQLYGWGFKTDSQAVTTKSSMYVVFMPVAKTDDMALLSALNKAAKEMRKDAGAVYERVRDIKSQFTRIKFADKDDSHIGFVDVSAKTAIRGKYRYGLSNAEAEKGIVDSETKLKRRGDALMYTGILETAKERSLRTGTSEKTKFYNEIIVAYRKHESPVYPVYTRWVGASFQVVQIAGKSMVDVPGKTISDKGQSTGF